MYFVLAILLGLLINYFTGGLGFNTALCFFVGLFLIMPILLKISLSDFKEIFQHKKLFLWSFLINFVFIPLIAFVVSYSIFGLENYPYIVALILLALIPGGGLLMSWLHHTKANLHIGFLIFTFNLLIFSGVYTLFNFGVDYFVKHYHLEKVEKKIETKNLFQQSLPINYNISQVEKKQQNGCALEAISEKVGLASPSCFKEDSSIYYGLFGFVVLILIPFVLSRIIRLFVKNQKILNYFSYLSKISAFVLITYIFSLQYVRSLFSIDKVLLFKMFLAVVLFYFLVFVILKIILKLIKLPSDVAKALFWNSYTRFITLTLILSFLYAIAWKKPEMILIPVLAYFVQIISASVGVYFGKKIIQ